ncbi:MAG TPA: class I SAM-dependent methyltransferase [Thermoanaerobaculia bacterium]|nr:class I SAM-dependent methyltransferase [Thermoanaerobaculia bacterium]
MSCFADHFSDRAAQYARYRPDYPEALFDFLAQLAPERKRAWDCATGSGQAARGLAGGFEKVVATDASLSQISSAAPHLRIRYAVAAAEEAPLADGSVALVTSAQSLHWFDRARFWREVWRVLVPGGIVAVWSYHGFHVTPEVEEVVYRLYRDIVGPYWPPERALVERGYGALEFPFAPVAAPEFRLEKAWDLPAMVGYLKTWSAARRYEAALGVDPVTLVREDLAAAWGPPERIRMFRWDLDLRVGRKPSG